MAQARTRHRRGVVDVAQIDEEIAGHRPTQPAQVETAELVPFGQTQLEQRLFKSSLISMGYGSRGAR